MLNQEAHGVPRPHLRYSPRVSVFHELCRICMPDYACRHIFCSSSWRTNSNQTAASNNQPGALCLLSAGLLALPEVHHRAIQNSPRVDSLGHVIFSIVSPQQVHTLISKIYFTCFLICVHIPLTHLGKLFHITRVMVYIKFRLDYVGLECNIIF